MKKIKVKEAPKRSIKLRDCDLDKIIDLLLMDDREFIKQLLMNASTEEKKEFYEEFPEYQDK